MKPDVSVPCEPGNSVRVRFQVQFSRNPRGRRRGRETEPPPVPAEENPSPRPKPAPSAERIPRITRMLVLGYHFEQLVREGKIKNYAEIARLTGLSRARVTQIVNLTLLAPQIQDHVLHASDGSSPPHEVAIRSASQAADWPEQHRRWR